MIQRQELKKQHTYESFLEQKELKATKMEEISFRVILEYRQVGVVGRPYD